MDVMEIRRLQSVLSSNIERMMTDYIRETGVVPVIETHCHENRTLDGRATHIPVVRIYSVLPEVSH
jgi:hypothetical protein